MNHDASSPLGRSAVILVLVAAAAVAMNLLFGHKLQIEPVGLLSFGLFCIGYSMVVTFLSRQHDLKQTPVFAEPKSELRSEPEFKSESRSRSDQTQGRPVIVRDVRPMQLRAPAPKARPSHALTIDLEDYFHTEVASQGVSFSEWEHQPSRIEASTNKLLDMMDSCNTKGTFFVLGWVAKRYPRLIHEIHQRGHEIGCHSLDHRLVSRMTPTEFTETTHVAKDIIESIIHESIFGYRAPCFSITPGTEWAFESLAKLGFAYDSSIHPVNHPVYGNPTAPRAPYTVAQGKLVEFPIATWKVAGRNLSVGGGAYLRLLPYQYIHRGLAAWEKEMQTPAMLYLHPWEIDPYQPYIPLKFQSKVRQTWGTATMEEKLQRLLGQFRFAPVREVHKTLLEGKCVSSRKPVYQHSEAAELVAG